MQTVQEYLEKNYREDLSEADAVRLTISALMEVVEAGSRNVEVAVAGRKGIEFLDEGRVKAEVRVYRFCNLLS